MLHSMEAVISLTNCEFGTAASAATVPGTLQGDHWAEILAGPPPQNALCGKNDNCLLVLSALI